MAPDKKRVFALSPQRLALIEAMLREQGVAVSSRHGIPRRKEADALTLSFAQERLWFLDKLVPGDASYNIPTVIELTGPLDVAALVSSLVQVVRRHEILRTTFKTVDGQPAQEISPEPRLALNVVDLRELPPMRREAAAIALAVEQARIPFDLAQGPLFRVTLLWLDRDRYQVAFTIHHICSDAWSADVFLREVMALYGALSRGMPDPLPELSIQYADYALWQRQWLQGDVLENQLAYWKKQLSGDLTVLSLPSDYPRPSVRTYRGAAQFFEIPSGSVAGLKRLGQTSGATLFMTMLAAFDCLLYRYTGQVDILVGSPVANRHHAQTAELIGFLINTLVLRTDLSGNPTFSTVLARVRQVVTEAYAHQDLPFERLVEELQAKRDTSHSPLFQVMFVMRTAMETMEYAGITLKQVEIHNGTAKRDLTLSFVETGEKLKGFVEYNADIFDDSTIVRMLGHFCTLLDGIVADPERRVADLPLLTEKEKRQWMETWNDTAAHFPQEASASVHHLFEVQAARTPEAIAVVSEEEQITYQALNRRANQLAYHLQRLGVRDETRVGLCVERSAEMVIGLLAIQKSGGAYVPLDPTYPPERLAYMIEETRMPVLVTQHQFAASLPSHSARVVCMDAEGEAMVREPGHNPVPRVTKSHLAYVLYTSGSSGRPKGVMVEHGQLLNYCLAVIERIGLAPGMSFAMLQPLTVDSSVTAIFPPLMTGGVLHVISRERSLDAHGLGDYFDEHFVDALKIAPSHLAALQACAAPERVMPRSRLIVGGEASHWNWMQSLQALSPDCAIFNHYGPTETTVGVLMYLLEQATPTHRSTAPLGRPLANTQVYVLDHYLNPCPVGVWGELYVGGANVARGYLNRPELTAAGFVPDPFSRAPGDRLYKTGDLARCLSGGTIEFAGRIDDQVKIHGFRVEPEEIEAVLAQHPAVRETAVIVREDKPGDKVLAAYLVLDRQPPPTPEQARGFLSAKLPQHMIPSVFVILDALPRTPHGKLDRRALPAPTNVRREGQASYVPPQTELEQIVSGIWQDLLQVDKIGMQDNFFELGGHSLLIVRMHARLEESLHRRFPLITLFNRPTVSDLAEYLSQGDQQRPALQQGYERGQRQQQVMKKRQQRTRTNRSL